MWGCAVQVAQGCGPGPGDLQVPSEEGEKDLVKGPRAPSRGGPSVPRPLGLALTWPGRLGVDFSGVRRLLGMSGW